MDALHSPQLDLHVRQVPHHPVEVVGDLRGVGEHLVPPRPPGRLFLPLRGQGPSMSSAGYSGGAPLEAGEGYDECGSLPTTCPGPRPWVSPPPSWSLLPQTQVAWGRAWRVSQVGKAPEIPRVLISEPSAAPVCGHSPLGRR